MADRMAEAERLVRERLGLFAKGEPPPGPPPSMFQQFVAEALGPAGLAIRAGTSAPLSPAPRTPVRLTPADYNAARAQLPPDASLAERTAVATQIRQQIAQQRPAGWYSMTPEQQRAHVAAHGSETDNLYQALTGRQPQITQPREIPLSSPEFLRGLNPQQRQTIQGYLDSGMDEVRLRAIVDRTRQASIRQTPQQAPDMPATLRGFNQYPDVGPPQFDINRFRPPERGRTKPGMSAVQGEVSATHGEAGAPGPGYGELGNFVEPPMPGQMQKPPGLADRLAQLPNPARRDLGYEMPIGEIRKGRRDWGIAYEPPGGGYGAIQASVDPRERVLQISGSQLPKSAQGKGIGQEMYRRLIDEAHREGLQVRSDNILSPYSNRIYERVLTGQGYDVKRNPYATRRNYGTYPHEVDEGGVYSVGPKERLPAPSLMDMLMRVPKKSPYAIAPVAPLGAHLIQPENEQ